MYISAKLSISSYTKRADSVKREDYLRVYAQRGRVIPAVCLALLLSFATHAEAQLPRPMEMQSAPLLAVGKVMPAVSAYNAEGEAVSIHDGKTKWTVVAFLSTRCPCTASYLARLDSLLRQFGERSVRFVGVNSNANELPEDVPAF